MISLETPSAYLRTAPSSTVSIATVGWTKQHTTRDTSENCHFRCTQLLHRRKLFSD